MRNGFLVMLILTGLLAGCNPEIPEHSTFMDADGYTGATPKELQDTSEKEPAESTPPTAPFQAATPLLAGAIFLFAALHAMRLHGAILREFVASTAMTTSGIWRPNGRAGGGLRKPCLKKPAPGGDSGESRAVFSG